MKIYQPSSNDRLFSAPFFPHVPTKLTSQALISQATVAVLASFLNALDFRRLCEDRFSQFMPATAVHRPGKQAAGFCANRTHQCACYGRVQSAESLPCFPGHHGILFLRSYGAIGSLPVNLVGYRDVDQRSGYPHATASLHTCHRKRRLHRQSQQPRRWALWFTSSM